MQNENGDLCGLLARLSSRPVPRAELPDVFTLTVCKPMADGSVQNTEPILVFVRQGQSLFAQIQVYQPAITWSYLRFGNKYPISFDKAPVDSRVIRDLDAWAALPDPPGGRVLYLEVL